MKFFIDTANVDEIREANDMGIICGVTTNPSLIAKEGRDFNEVIKEITSIVDGPISGEVKATTVKAEDIPTDLLTASGSGLDPHISPSAAEVQVPRIAAASGLSEEKVREIIGNNTEGKLLGIFGEETVNVLRVNLELAQEMGVC